MSTPTRGRRSLRWSLDRSLFGLVAVVATTDAALLLVTPVGGVAELARAALAALAVLAVALGVVAAAVRGPIYAPLPVLALPLVVVYGYTGLLLPWTQLSFVLAQGSTGMLLSVPVVGEPLATGLLGDVGLTQRTLRTAFRYHYAITFVVLLGVCCLGGRAALSRRPASEAN